jgi:hypothetical protein
VLSQPPIEDVHHEVIGVSSSWFPSVGIQMYKLMNHALRRNSMLKIRGSRLSYTLKLVLDSIARANSILEHARKSLQFLMFRKSLPDSKREERGEKSVRRSERLGLSRVMRMRMRMMKSMMRKMIVNTEYGSCVYQSLLIDATFLIGFRAFITMNLPC